MSDFPTKIYQGRDTENLPGIVFNPADKKNFYSEDFQNLVSEIKAIETYLEDITGLSLFGDLNIPTGNDIKNSGAGTQYNTIRVYKSEDGSMVFDTHYGSDEYGGFLFTSQNRGLKCFKIVGDGRMVIGKDTVEKDVAFEVFSSNKAFLLPRVNTTYRDSMVPVNGMLIYNIVLNKFQGYENGAWVSLI